MIQKDLLFRKIEKDDFNKYYLQLLQHLSIIQPNEISIQQFNHFVENLTTNHSIFIIEDTSSQSIIGSITLLIEDKIIHNMGKVGHIEDVVVHPAYRGQQLGKILVEKVIEIAKQMNCYKVILDCQDKNKVFYEKCCFEHKGNQMSKYF